MPAAANGSFSNGGPSVGSRNGASSFINAKGNASAFGNNIAQMTSNGAIVTEPELSKSNGVPQLNGNAHLSDGTHLGRAEETDDVS